MKVYLDTIGCRLNQAEIEKFAVQFRAAGHKLVGTAAEADLVIVNTCAVTAEAGSDSRQRLRQAAKAGNAEIIATGCLSTLEGDSLLRLPGMIGNVPNSEKTFLVDKFLNERDQSTTRVPQDRQSIPGRRERTRAFIKVQDGCDNHCTFCITHIIRGKARSVPISEILDDIHSAMEGGSKEVVLSGVQLGSWGSDFVPPKNLAFLVQTIMNKTSVPRIRLSSVEPWDLNDDFFELWMNPRMCRQLHLPLQSGSNKVLKLMGRKNTCQQYESLVKKVKAICPMIAITTDILVGFPGESDADHQQTLDFIQRIKYAAGHVFVFSPRPGTSAENLPNQIPTGIKKSRSKEIRGLFSNQVEEFHQQFIGDKLKVLWEKSSPDNGNGFLLEGWTDNYIRVFARNRQDLHNEISLVKLIEPKDDRMYVEICGG